MADFISIDSTTWKSIPKDDPRDRVEAIVGDDKQAEFYPQVKIQRWDNEVNFSVRLIEDRKQKEAKEGKDKIIWAGDDVSMEFYDVLRNSNHVVNQLKFEYLIKVKPSSNQIRFSLESKGVAFYKQVAMNERHPSGYSDFFGREIISNRTQVFDAQTGEELASCDDDIPGGYAVFQAERKRNYVNGKLYRCGMVGLIYCPKIIDAVGKWTWGELDIDPIKKTYVVTIPQKFLDTATYPIRSNDTFGDETLGGAFTTIGATCKANLSHTYAATAGDEITKYSIGCLGYDVGQTFDVAAYTFAGGVPVTRAGTPGTAPAVNGVEAYQDTGAVSHTLGSATYCLAVGNGNGSQRIAYTSSIGDHSRHTASSALPATWAEDGTGTDEISIYATYTPAGGGEPQTIIPSGIASLEAFGTSQANFGLLPSGIASLEAFGTPQLNFTVYPGAITTGEVFGSHVVTLQGGPQTLIPDGIGSLEAFGTLEITLFLSPSSIGTGEALGTPQLNLTVLPSGVASGEAFGSPTILLYLSPSGIASAEAFGTAQVNLQLLASGIVSGEAFGTATFRLYLLPTGIGSGEAFGTHVVSLAGSGLTISPSGIASGEAFGTAALQMFAQIYETIMTAYLEKDPGMKACTEREDDMEARTEDKLNIKGRV